MGGWANTCAGGFPRAPSSGALDCYNEVRVEFCQNTAILLKQPPPMKKGSYPWPKGKPSFLSGRESNENGFVDPVFLMMLNVLEVFLQYLLQNPPSHQHLQTAEILQFSR